MQKTTQCELILELCTRCRSYVVGAQQQRLTYKIYMTPQNTLGWSHTKLVVSETVCMCIATYSLQKLLQMTQGHNIYIFLRIPN